MTSHDGWFLRHFVKLRLILQRRWILIIVATLVVRREELNILCKKNFNKSSILRIGLATVMKNNVIMGDTQTDRPTLARSFKRLFYMSRGVKSYLIEKKILFLFFSWLINFKYSAPILKFAWNCRSISQLWCYIGHTYKHHLASKKISENFQ